MLWLFIDGGGAQKRTISQQKNGVREWKVSFFLSLIGRGG
jgi:hypothetical protein